MADSVLKILAIQPQVKDSSTGEEKVKFLGHLAELIEEEISKHGVPDLVMLPELSTIEYSRKAFSKLDELAEDLDGPAVQVFGRLAKKHSVYISYGGPRKEGDKYRISNFVIDNTGKLITYYDKIHLAQFGASMEREYYTKGNHLSIFDIGKFRIATVICYDIRFSEIFNHLRDNLGVNVILHPVAFTMDSTFASWHQFVVTRALENHVYVLSLNRAGEHWGKSIFCPPWIDDEIEPTVFGLEQESGIIELKYSAISEARKQYTFYEDSVGDYTKLDVK